MAKRGSFVDRQSAKIDEKMQTAERVTRQFDVDSWQIALARYQKLDLGYQRIMEITELAEQVRAEYSGAIAKGPEQDLYRNHMDEELRQIAKDKGRLIPFEKRYPELKKPDYRGRKERYGH